MNFEILARWTKVSVHMIEKNKKIKKITNKQTNVGK